MLELPLPLLIIPGFALVALVLWSGAGLLGFLVIALAALCIWADAEFLALVIALGFAVFALS